MRIVLRMLKHYYLGIPTLCRVGLDWRLHYYAYLLYLLTELPKEDCDIDELMPWRFDKN